MRVLVACEYSGIVREAFASKGHYAVSVDLLPTEIPSSRHYTGDVFELLKYEPDWDMLLAFPPCTYLCSSGLHWNKRIEGRAEKTEEALKFLQRLMDLPIPKKCIENPIGCISTRIRKPNQIIQPWQHGHGETKSTCLWLEGLPELVPSNIVDGREARIWKMGPSKDRGKLRSKTYQGIADAMADQWG